MIECINFTVTYPEQSGTILVDKYSVMPGATSSTERCLKNVDADSNSVLGVLLSDPYTDMNTFFAAIEYSYTLTMYGEVEDNTITNGFTRRLIYERYPTKHGPMFDHLETLTDHTEKDIFFSSSWISRCTRKPDPVECRSKGTNFGLHAIEYEISCPGNDENAIINVGKQEAVDYMFANDTNFNFNPTTDLRTETFNYAA